MLSKKVITYLYMGYIGVITHLLTIDPNFLGHPSEPRKNPPTFHYTGWLIGILIMDYYNPYITG